MNFDTMRSNCIQIHQEVFELFRLSEQQNIPIDITVKSADELKKHPDTKSWDGMGRYAKKLYDNKELWESLPESATINIDVAFEGQTKVWNKKEAMESLLDCSKNLEA